LGVYNVTLTAFNVLSNVAASVEYSLFPAYSHMQNPQQRADLSPAMRDASRYSSFVVTPLALGLLATAKPALTLFVGQAYVEGSGPLVILSGTLAVTAFGTAIGPMLLALGQTRISSFITILSVILSLLLAFFLMPTTGMTGAAIARGFAMIIGTVLTFYFLRRKITVKLDLEAIAKSLTASAIMAVVVFAIQVPLYSKFLLPAYVLVGAAIYLVALRLLRAVRQGDIDLTRKFLGRELSFIADILEVVRETMAYQVFWLGRRLSMSSMSRP
jgi:O-antigen/teichoic acid export membrane protein